MLRRQCAIWPAALAAIWVSCAHEAPRPAPAATEAAAPVENRVKLAILPVESDVFPQLARFLNEVMSDVHVKGVDDYFVSKVPLEVVQLSIECVEASTACYGTVGKSLTAQQLLLAHIAAAGTRRHDKSVQVTVTWFDVETGKARNEAQQTFKSEADAMSAISDLVGQALSTAGGAAASSERVAQ
jgi:hypothetical protein